jgi:hypothetical protein
MGTTVCCPPGFSGGDASSLFQKLAMHLLRSRLASVLLFVQYKTGASAPSASGMCCELVGPASDLGGCLLMPVGAVCLLMTSWWQVGHNCQDLDCVSKPNPWLNPTAQRL